jgi:uncharacterized protein YdeI (YjbR/CyaY-like superfamily)
MSERKTVDYPVLHFEDQQSWRVWLHEYHAGSRGVWLRLAKKAAQVSSVQYAEALEIALCYGWIDGQKQADDDQFWLQKFTPRSARSAWSRINREKAEALIENGLMQPAGLSEVERARADGRWQAAYDSASKATVPDDLQQALDANPKASAFFATLDRQNRYAILYRVQTAKKAETRARRIRDYVAMLARHEKLHP